MLKCTIWVIHVFSSPSLALPHLPSTSWEERVSQVSYCQDLCLAQLWIARIIIVFTQQSWASFLRMDVRCFICSEWGLFGCTVWAMYCERYLEEQISCTDWYHGEDASFSQDCSKKTQHNKASPRGTGGFLRTAETKSWCSHCDSCVSDYLHPMSCQVKFIRCLGACVRDWGGLLRDL